MSDDFDDWGDDPFGGDLDFDDDFDKPASSKGFIRSFATGFLSGLVEKTIGDTDARINTLKMGLPRTWMGTFSNLRTLNERSREVLTDIKAESFTTVQDLQYLAGRAAKKLSGGATNKISEQLNRFSEHDFSDWEKTEGNTDDSVSMEDTSDEDVANILNNENANSMLERETMEAVGTRTIAAMNEVGGRQIAGLHHLATELVRTNNHLQTLVDYQRKVQARNDAMMLNVTARHYLTSAKFYKFMEASQHRSIQELKAITRFSRMSDYEKTSNSDAFKRSVRESVFNTAKSSFGGIRDLIIDKFGKDARDSSIGAVGEIAGALRMASEMSEGMEMDYGSIMGNAAAGIFINNLPRMIKSERGRAYLDKFKKQFPKQAKWAEDAYIRLEDLGNVATYFTGNAEGMVNTMAKHYRSDMMNDEAQTYEEYVDSLEDPSKAISKLDWTLTHHGRKIANKGISSVLENMWNSDGSSYSLTRRTLKDSFERHLWTRQSDRTLNEIIPAWFSKVHLSLEKIRTGNDNIQAESYDYVKGRFINEKQKVATAVNSVLNHDQFSMQANAAKDLVANIDKDNALSPKAKEALAFRLARDTDKKLGFSPYNYLRFDDDDELDKMPKKVQEEIRKVMMANFGITEDHMKTFFETGTNYDVGKMLNYMPTEDGRALLASVFEQANSLSEFVPDVSNMLDIMRSTGSYDALKQAGIIRTNQSGHEEVSQDLLWNTFRQYIKDPNRKSAVMPKDTAALPTRPWGGDSNPGDATPLGGGNPAPTGPGGAPAAIQVEGMDKVVESLGNLDQLKQTIAGFQGFPSAAQFDLTPVSTGLETLNAKIAEIATLNGVNNDLLAKILDRQPIATAKAPSKDEESTIQKAKRSLIEKIKGFSMKDTFNKGVEVLLDHEPMILGGLLGGMGMLAFHNPKAAALIGGGAAVALAYGKIRSLAMARNADDSEDLYEEGSDIPILEANKLANKNYYDATKGFLIESWSQITGSVRDATNDTIIGARRLAGKLFTAENKEVFLKGLDKVREWLVKAFHVVDPFGRLTRMKDKIVNRFKQMDVYKEGAEAPTLLGKSFAGGAYYKQVDGNMVVLNGWDEIDGPVYDRDGNVLITQEDYDRGLKTSMGVSINKLGAFGKRSAGWLKELGIKIKDKAAPYAGKAKDGVVSAFKADYSPIITSVDRIHNLLLKHWGYQSSMPEVGSGSVDEHGNETHEVPPEEQARREEADKTPSGEAGKGFLGNINAAVQQTIKNRLNSAADKEQKEKEAKTEAAQDALINISKNFSGFGGKEDEKKKTGFFGMLSSIFSGMTSAMVGISKFMFGPMWGALKLLGTFASVGIKALPFIATGIGALTKGIFALLSKGGGVAGDLLGGITGRGRRGQPPRSNKSRMLSGAKGLGVGLAVLGATDALAASGAIDADGVMGTVLDGVGTAANIYGGVQLASAAAGLAGTSLTGMATTAASAVAGFAAPLLFNPVTLGVLAVGAAGYGIYKYVTRGAGKQIELRMAQYGCFDVESDLAKKILKAEEMLSEFVVIGNARASMDRRAPLEEVAKMFVEDPKNNKEVGSVYTWFNGRFKPVFLTYMACLDVVKMKSLKEYDESKDRNVYNVAKQAHQALSAVMPFPYSVVAKIDRDTPIMGQQATVIRVNNLLTELKAYIDRHTDKKDELKPIATPASTTALQQEKAKLEEALKNPAKNFGSGVESIKRQDEARNRLTEIDGQLKQLNVKYKAGSVVAGVFIKDLLPDERAMDLMTAIRVACYGNDQDVPWRVEAVLRLERYSEQYLVYNGDDVTFNGLIGDLFGQFKDAFRLENGDAEDWCKWFRDRFLPVFLTYAKTMTHYRKGRPGLVWKSLSATARFEIAKALVDAKAEITKALTVPIWNVKVSPFKDAGRSADRYDKVDRMLKLLGEASTQAKLRDPEAEAGRTSSSAWANAISPHKTGGGYTEKQFNTMTADQAKNKRDVAGSGTYGTNTNRGAGTGNTFGGGGVYLTPATQYGYKALTGDSDTSHLDMSGVKSQGAQGTDSGVKVPKKLAEQLVIREMLKQGFTDPREIAMLLALTNYESGGYSQTVENMKYSSPERLVKMFKEVTSIEQARQLIAGGEVAIANAVYGGAKGASLGNNAPGDGYRYRGRGFNHLTGKANYAKYSRSLGIDLVNKPELLSTDPNVMAAVAVEFYKNSKQMQAIKTNGDFGYAAKGLNGGNDLPGMDKRYSMYLSYLKQLESGSLKADEASAAGVNTPDNADTGAGGLYTPIPKASGPMLGSGAAPMMGAAPGGGMMGGGQYTTPSSGGGGGLYSGNYGNQGGPAYMGTGAPGSGAGLRLKSPEAVAGGAHHKGVDAACKMIQMRVPNFRYWSALNDAYHVRVGSKGSHPKGLAADFTLTNGVAGSDVAVRIVQEIFGQAGLTNADVMVINEYRTKTANGTGGHVHFHFKSTQAADKFLAASGGTQENGQDTTPAGGGPVQEQDRGQPVPPPVEPIGTIPPDTAKQMAANNAAATAPAVSTGGPTPPPPSAPTPAPRAPVAEAPAPTRPKATAPEPQSAPQQPAAPAIDTAALTQAIAQAVSSGDQATVVLLKGILDELKKFNTNASKPSRVNV